MLEREAVTHSCRQELLDGRVELRRLFGRAPVLQEGEEGRQLLQVESGEGNRTHRYCSRPALVGELEHGPVDGLDLDLLLLLEERAARRVVRDRAKVEAARKAGRDGPDAACEGMRVSSGCAQRWERGGEGRDAP